jgi:hypothetical protein
LNLEPSATGRRATFIVANLSSRNPAHPFASGIAGKRSTAVDFLNFAVSECEN